MRAVRVEEGLDEIPVVPDCGSVVEADFSRNSIVSVALLSSYPSLRSLNLDRNPLSRSALAWPPLPHLTHLSLNFCANVTDLTLLAPPLAIAAPGLAELSLFGCPALPPLSDAAAQASYRSFIASYFSALRCLDGSRLSKAEIAAGRQLAQERRDDDASGTVRASYAQLRVATPLESSLPSGQGAKPLGTGLKVRAGIDSTPFVPSAVVITQAPAPTGPTRRLISEGNRFITEDAL
jgi:hypothetical protein